MSRRFDELRSNDNNGNNVGVTLFAGNVYYSWQTIPAALLVPIAGIILIGVILGWATGLNKSADVVGAVSSFFGYLGFDAMACVAGEAINAERNSLLNIMITLAIVTTLYVAAAVGVVAAAAAAVAAAEAAVAVAAAAVAAAAAAATITNVWMMKCNKGCG
jgi:hypothetical protein